MTDFTVDINKEAIPLTINMVVRELIADVFNTFEKSLYTAKSVSVVKFYELLKLLLLEAYDRFIATNTDIAEKARIYDDYADNKSAYLTAISKNAGNLIPYSYHKKSDLLAETRQYIVETQDGFIKAAGFLYEQGVDPNQVDIKNNPYCYYDDSEEIWFFLGEDDCVEPWWLDIDTEPCSLPSHLAEIEFEFRSASYKQRSDINL